MSESPISLRDETGVERFRGTQSPGGGSSPVSVARVVIANADILTLPTTPVQIVATPGAGKMLLPLNALLVADTTAATYGQITGGVLGLDPDGTFGAYPLATLLDESAGQVSSLLNPTGSAPDPGAKALAVLGPQETVQSAAPVTTGALSNAQDPASYEDKPILLACSNPFDFSDGDAANTLTVTVVYTEVTL